jgi:hypothetical protein
MAKTPFKVISTAMIATSNQGNGVRGGSGDMACGGKSPSRYFFR